MRRSAQQSVVVSRSLFARAHAPRSAGLWACAALALIACAVKSDGIGVSTLEGGTTGGSSLPAQTGGAGASASGSMTATGGASASGGMGTGGVPATGGVPGAGGTPTMGAGGKSAVGGAGGTTMGAGGRPANGGNPGSMGGAAGMPSPGTGGVAPGTGGNGGQGNAGTGGATSFDGGVAGHPGTTPDTAPPSPDPETCCQIAEAYEKALPDAKACNRDRDNQCGIIAPASLACGCTTFVNTAEALTPLVEKWKAEGCHTDICPRLVCTAIVCRAPGDGVCTNASGPGNVDSCVDRN